MKKSLSILLVTSLAACISCSKQEIQAGGEQPENNIPTTGRLDYITAVSPGTPVKTTTADGVKVLWTDNDRIGMYAEGASTALYTTSLSEPSAQAKFGRTSDVSPVKVGDRYYAVYPSSAIVKWNFETGQNETTGPVCTVNVPKQQTAEVGAWDKKAAVLIANSETEQFVFKHAVSYVRFEVTEQTGEFVSVRLSSVNKERLSDMQAGIQYLADGGVQMVSSLSATDYVSLRNSENGVPFSTGVYNIAILPGDFTGGLVLSFENAEGLVAEKSMGPLALNAGEVSDWGQVEKLNFTEGNNPLEVATVYKENDINQGVVYWVDPDNPFKGKIISASSTEAMDWSENISVEFLWTEKIASLTDGLANYQQFNASDVYTSQKEKFYALNYCEKLRESHGGNWYLPAPQELSALVQVYYGLSELPGSSSNEIDYRFENSVLIPSVMNAKAEFDAALRLLGETKTATLDGDADGDGVSDDNGYGDARGVTYWTSKVNTGGSVQYVNIGTYFVSHITKAATKGYVRCVRDVELNSSGGGNEGEDPGEEPGGNPGENPGGNPGETPGGNPGETPGEGDDTGGDDTGGDNTGDGTGEQGGIAPLNPFDIFNQPIRVSLVGDSITTYEGTLVTNFDSENGGAYYPTGNVTSVTNQYWHKLIYNKMTSAVLEVNNSLRGSCVVRRDTHSGADYPARVQLHGLGNPDIIFIHGGTNDCSKHSADYAPRPGFYRADMYPGDAYAGMAPSTLPTAAEFKAVYDAAEAADTWEEIVALEDGYFVHAYVKLLNMIRFKHPNAKVVIIIGDALTKRAQQALLEIADHYGQLYGYKCVNFFGLAASISKASGAHPDDAGFTYMADKIFQEVGSYINVR